MRNILSQKNGFSLVELLVGILLLSLLMAAVFGLLSTSLGSFRYNFTQNRNVEDARMSINALADELRYATDITAGPANGTTLNLTDGNSFAYVVKVNGVDVARTLTRPATGTNAKTFVLQGGNSAVYPSVVFGRGIVTSLTITRTDLLTEKKIQLTISLTTDDQSYAGGQSLTTSVDVIPHNIKLP